MLKYLKFSYSNSKAKISFKAYVEDKKLKLQKSLSDYEEINSCPVSDTECKIWLENLEKLHLEKWKPKNMAKTDFDDGKWSIDYKRKGKRSCRIKGEGIYPDNWDDFLTLMYKLSPLTEPDRIEKTEIIFKGKTYIKSDADKSYTKDTSFANCTENLVLDRQKDTITYSRKINGAIIFDKHCYLKEAVSSLLDECKPLLINPLTKDAYKEKGEATLTVSLHFLKNADLTHKFTYNGQDLPQKVKDTIETIFSSVSLFEEKGELYSQSVQTSSVNELEYSPENIKNTNEKVYCPFCKREIERDMCYEIYESTKSININTDMPDWVKEELQKKSEFCKSCENRPNI